MVKKLVLDMHDVSNTNIEEDDLYKCNSALQTLVTLYKDKINEYYKNKLWDKYKKISNEYELVFTSPNTTSNISKYNPVSRSFFKLWEVLYDFEDKVMKQRDMKAVFLAEGPGGFTEAFLKKRAAFNDECYGITLKSNNNKNIPDWKIHQFEKFKVCYGKDGTGNLYNIDNIEHFKDYVGEHACDFITADGGFDFSSDFNNQEDLSIRLILSEVLLALLIQKLGGCFLLKVYDCFNDHTIQIINILKAFYKHIYFIKPLTSRPANSERYLLCTDFHMDDAQLYQHVVQSLRQKITHFTGNEKDIVENMPVDKGVLYHIVLYNFYYSMRQVYYIQRTINYINFFRNKQDDTVLHALLEKHTKKSKDWCGKYNIECKE